MKSLIPLTEILPKIPRTSKDRRTLAKLLNDAFTEVVIYPTHFETLLTTCLADQQLFVEEQLEEKYSDLSSLDDFPFGENEKKSIIKYIQDIKAYSANLDNQIKELESVLFDEHAVFKLSSKIAIQENNGVNCELLEAGRLVNNKFVRCYELSSIGAKTFCGKLELKHLNVLKKEQRNIINNKNISDRLKSSIASSVDSYRRSLTDPRNEVTTRKFLMSMFHYIIDNDSELKFNNGNINYSKFHNKVVAESKVFQDSRGGSYQRFLEVMAESEIIAEDPSLK